MTDEKRRGIYTHGYDQKVVQQMGNRRAEREAAFFFPHLRPRMRLLDVGCGPGTITIGLAAAVAPGEVLGIDLEPAVVEQARALAKDQGITNVRFEVWPAEELPLADESFDADFEHTLLEHVASPSRVVQEMHRVLRPGRVIGLADGDWETMVIEPVVPDFVEGLALYERMWRHNGGNPRFGRHQHAILRQAGFRHGETMLKGVEVTPERSAFIAERFLSPRFADVAIGLGWADRPTLERYAQGVRTWAKHPDALLITAELTTVGWRV